MYGIIQLCSSVTELTDNALLYTAHGNVVNLVRVLSKFILYSEDKLNVTSVW